MPKDSVKWHPVVRVLKYNSPKVAELTDYLGHEPNGLDLRRLTEPDEIVEREGNALVDGGAQRLSDLITGSGQAYTDLRGMGGVGDGAAVTTSGMTALQGTNQLYKGVDTAPSSATGVISSAVTFSTAEANFAWEEWCWAIATATPVTDADFATATTSGVMLNRKAQSLGTKVNGVVWTLQASITIS